MTETAFDASRRQDFVKVAGMPFFVCGYMTPAVRAPVKRTARIGALRPSRSGMDNAKKIFAGFMVNGPSPGRDRMKNRRKTGIARFAPCICRPPGVPRAGRAVVAAGHDMPSYDR